MVDRERGDAVLQSDAAFEKWLLDAAGSDGPPPGAAAAAWAQFAQAATSAVPHATSAVPHATSAVPHATVPHSVSQRGGLPASGAAAGASGATIAKWIGVGAVGGTILGGWLAAFVLRGEVESEPARVEGLGASSAEAPAPAGSGGRAPELEAPAAHPPASRDDGARRDDDGASPPRGSSAQPLPQAPRAKVQRDGRRQARALPAPTSQGDAPAASRRASSLEREVALLDEIRVANSSGDFARGIELVARYRSEFEDGELARDADVFEMEALAGQGERARAAEAARAFLARYPGDPHTPRVRALAAPVSR
jgi:hypothetical protein